MIESMLIRFLKRNSILLGFFGFYLAGVVLVLLVYDKQYYQAEKKQVIIDRGYHFVINRVGSKRIDELLTLSRDLLKNKRPEDQQDLVDLIHTILAGNNIIYRIAVRPATRPPGEVPSATTSRQGAEGTIVDWSDTMIPADAAGQERKREKLTEFNQWSNTLFLRHFSARSQYVLQDDPENPYGWLMLYYTSPLGDPQINELTQLYRWRSLFIVLILTTLAIVIARSLLMPLRNVTNSLETSTQERTVFLPRPRNRLETLYNRMALGALMARLQAQLRDQIGRNPQMTSWEVVTFICQQVSAQIDAPMMACLEMVAEGPGRIRSTGTRVFAGRASETRQAELPELAHLIDQAMPRDGRSQARCAILLDGKHFDSALHLISDPERVGIRYLFAMALMVRTDEATFLSLRNILDQLVALVDSGLQTLSLRNQLLVQERGRANISLSRNLGHDLTNIIATSKLELMALDRLLGDGKAPNDERRRGILAESLKGLLRSIRFMQETVNLYRAYAFLQHPVREIQEGDKLVSETLDLFEISVSAKVRLMRELAEDTPRCQVDPRLIKLALFNLFTNALEAIRKGDPEHTAQGEIKVITRRSRNGGLCIAIEDSGTGILSHAGERAQGHEIERIFELGHTTRRFSGKQGEGLGLNWVRTIIQDLHNGAIWAENIDGGGARFILTLPAIEEVSETYSVNNKPDRV